MLAWDMNARLGLANPRHSREFVHSPERDLNARLGYECSPGIGKSQAFPRICPSPGAQFELNPRTISKRGK